MSEKDILENRKSKNSINLCDSNVPSIKFPLKNDIYFYTKNFPSMVIDKNWLVLKAHQNGMIPTLFNFQ